MALQVATRWDPTLATVVTAAWQWLADTQRPDGTWPARTRLGGDGLRIPAPGHDHVESNFCAYPAVGIAHHVLATGSMAAAARWFPMVAAGIDAALSMQVPDGTIGWGRGAGGVCHEALVTSCASIHQALRAGILLADLVGQTVPDWELAAAQLGHALAHHQGWFADRARFSMDWYYPVLGGAVRGTAAHDRIAARWDDFVVPGLGIRCVDDQPWVTGAETCELALAMQAIGATDEATDLVASMQHLRTGHGSYWTGWVWPDRAHWPVERSTWTGAAMLLACDAIEPTSPASHLFLDALPVVAPAPEVACADVACAA